MVNHNITIDQEFNIWLRYVMGQNPGTLGTLSHSWLMDGYSPSHMVTIGFDRSPYQLTIHLRRICPRAAAPVLCLCIARQGGAQSCSQLMHWAWPLWPSIYLLHVCVYLCVYTHNYGCDQFEAFDYLDDCPVYCWWYCSCLATFAYPGHCWCAPSKRRHSCPSSSGTGCIPKGPCNLEMVTCPFTSLTSTIHFLAKNPMEKPWFLDVHHT